MHSYKFNILVKPALLNALVTQPLNSSIKLFYPNILTVKTFLKPFTAHRITQLHKSKHSALLLL